jgi:hypothetical protein
MILSDSVNGMPQQERPSGYVLLVKGDWLLNGKKIEKGQAVRPGDTITPKSVGKDSQITVALYNQQVISRSCVSPDNCKGAISIPIINQSNPVIERILKVVAMAFLSGKSEKPGIVQPVSRGQSLHESVVRLNDGKIDLTDFLSGIDPGKYTLNFKPLAPDGVPLNETGIKVEVTIPGGSNQTLLFSAEALRPGLYRVVKADNKAEAWVLLTQARSYDATAAAFNEAVKLTDAWKREEVDYATKRSVLRAWLSHLATPGN